MTPSKIHLDDLAALRRQDPHGMLAEIDNLPAQLQSAWELGRQQPLGNLKRQIFSRILIAGMGGSAIGADLVAAYAAPICRLPVTVHRDYGLPAWAQGAGTLVIASSHSGNTEETLDTFENARKNNCSLLALCTGGRLAELAGEAGIPAWKFEHKGQPRAAIGFSFGLLLAAFTRLGFLPDAELEMQDTLEALHARQAELGAEVKAVRNPAKQMAAQLARRWTVVYGSGRLAPVARRWKGQFNELAKAGSGFESLPEADHNTLAGASFPQQALAHTAHIFLDSALEDPRNIRRSALTRQALKEAGLRVETCQTAGGTPLAQMWTSILFGDYTAFYLAMLYGVDPWDTGMLERFKRSIKTG